MKRIVSTLLALLLVSLIGFIGSAPASATPHSNEAVCPEYEVEPNKKDLTGEQTSVTVTAPAGMVIVGYCVKAGSANQGLGPHEVTGLYATTVVITYPSTPPKAISHYTLDFEPVNPAPPTEEIIKIQPPAPFPMDYCGVEFDDIEIPKDEDHKLPISYVRVDHDTVVAEPNKGFSFHEDLIVKWDFTFSTAPCPTPITVQPDAPVFGDQCGTVNDTVSWKEDAVGYSYVREGDAIVAKPWEGHFFVQDIMKTSWKIELTDIPCEDVVVPPVTDAPPAVDAPPVADAPPAANVPPVQNVTPVTDAPVIPVSSSVEPVSDASALDADLTGGDKTQSIEQLANTGVSIPVAAAVSFAVLLLLLGVWIRFGKRPLSVEK